MALLLASCLVGWLRLAGPLGSDLEVLLCLAVNFLSMRRSEASWWAWSGPTKPGFHKPGF